MLIETNIPPTARSYTSSKDLELSVLEIMLTNLVTIPALTSLCWIAIKRCVNLARTLW